MLTEDKPVVIVGFPIISKLVRGLTVVLSNVCLIPDDQLHNESVNMNCTAVFEKPQNKDNSEAVEQPSTSVKSSAGATACGTLPANFKERFTKFIAEQKDIPSEFAQVVNDSFWDLVCR